MVGFKNRYMVMEVFVDPNRDHMVDDPIIITEFNLLKAIKDSLRENFGECGLASSLGSLHGSIRACRNAALKCEESKFEHYKLVVGAKLTAEVTKQVQNCIDRIKGLEH